MNVRVQEGMRCAYDEKERVVRIVTREPSSDGTPEIVIYAMKVCAGIVARAWPMLTPRTALTLVHEEKVRRIRGGFGDSRRCFVCGMNTLLHVCGWTADMDGWNKLCMYNLTTLTKCTFSPRSSA